ncbi:MAG: sugar phosphate nucleotidyltransferase [Candidatus Helarchaeales archaeon]
MKKLKIICPIAGVGRRLQPFTYSKPKAFLKLAGRTIIDHAMDMLKKAFEKGTEILFIIGYKKEMIRQHIEKNYLDYFNLKFVEQKARGLTKEIPIFPGLGHAIYLARESGFLPKDNDDFGSFIFLSDRLPIDGFKGIYQKFQETDFNGIINISIVDDPEHYGVIKLDESGIITRLVEKPKEFISNMVISGIYVFDIDTTNVILDYLEAEIQKPIGLEEEYQFTPAIQHAVEKGLKISVHEMENEILDIGRPDSFLLGNKYFLERTSFDLKLYKAINSNIIPPSYIGKNVVINHSIVGPFVSVGDDVELTNTIISNSVIGDFSSLNRVITSGSILGEDIHLEDVIKDKMIVGDRSVISSRKNSEKKR